MSVAKVTEKVTGLVTSANHKKKAGRAQAMKARTEKN